jgi:hypothetical protein
MGGKIGMACSGMFLETDQMCIVVSSLESAKSQERCADEVVVVVNSGLASIAGTWCEAMQCFAKQPDYSQRVL